MEMVEHRYPFQFNDRAICEEEFEGWIPRNPNEYGHAMMTREKVVSNDRKIKWRYADE